MDRYAADIIAKTFEENGIEFIREKDTGMWKHELISVCVPRQSGDEVKVVFRPLYTMVSVHLPVILIPQEKRSNDMEARVKLACDASHLLLGLPPEERNYCTAESLLIWRGKANPNDLGFSPYPADVIRQRWDTGGDVRQERDTGDVYYSKAPRYSHHSKRFLWKSFRFNCPESIIMTGSISIDGDMGKTVLEILNEITLIIDDAKDYFYKALYTDEIFTTEDARHYFLKEYHYSAWDNIKDTTFFRII